MIYRTKAAKYTMNIIKFIIGVLSGISCIIYLPFYLIGKGVEASVKAFVK